MYIYLEDEANKICCWTDSVEERQESSMTQLISLKQLDKNWVPFIGRKLDYRGVKTYPNLDTRHWERTARTQSLC